MCSLVCEKLKNILEDKVENYLAIQNVDWVKEAEVWG